METITTSHDTAAIADATDLAIDAKAKTTKKKVSSLARDMDRAIATENAKPKTGKTKKAKTASDDGPPAAPKTTKKAKAKKNDEAAPETPGAAAVAAPEDVPMDAPVKKTRAPRTPKADAAPEAPSAKETLDALWNDDARPRTGLLTVAALADAYILHLENGGQTTVSTCSSYKNDLKTAVAFFGADLAVSGITRTRLADFNVCDGVMKLKNGTPKAMPTILKMRRAFRMAVEWARGNEITAYAVAP